MKAFGQSLFFFGCGGTIALIYYYLCWRIASTYLDEDDTMIVFFIGMLPISIIVGAALYLYGTA